MFNEFYQDYRHYKRWNYNNPKVISKIALESMMLRQAHMIEKGMSLSVPRRGFGQQKIETLFEMMENYVKTGFPTNSISFQNAIVVLDEYIEMQREIGYENPVIINKLDKYSKYRISGIESGITICNKENILDVINQPFPKFFESRHSVRQFDDKLVEVEDVKEAIKIAQRAPSACNRQASKVYMYTDKVINDQLGKLIAGNTGFEQEVRNYLVVTANVSAFYDSFERNQLYIEAGLFTMGLIQALHYKGIGSCILQNGEYYRKNKRFKNICKNIPESERIVLFIAIGYYKNEFTYAVSMRKDLEEVFIVK